MRWQWLPWLLTALWLQVAPPAAQTGTLAGHVVDGAGVAVPDAVVIVRPMGVVNVRPGSGPVPVRADGNGRFVVTNVPPGRFGIEVTKSGWLTGAYGRLRPSGVAGEIALGAGESRTDIRVVLWRPAVIGGAVTTDKGDPLVSAEVRAVRLGWVAGRRRPVDYDWRNRLPRAKTDDRGVYRFFDLPPGDYVVAVISTVLNEPATFAGAIRAAGETPRAYLQTMAGGGTMPMVFDRATMPAGGSETLVGSLGDHGQYATTYFPSSQTESGATLITVKSGDVQDAVNIHVTSVAAVRVTGTLTAPDGPAAWHAVHLVQADTDDRPLVDVATAVTDANGRFVFARVPPGEFIARSVRIPWPAGGARLGVVGGTGEIPSIGTMFGGGQPTPPGAPPDPALFVSQPVSVGTRPIDNLHLTMVEGPRVRGQVEFVGAAPRPSPEQMARVGVVLAAANGRVDANVMPARPDAAGQFVGGVIWPGRYVVTAQPPPGWYFKGATFQGLNVTDTPWHVDDDVSGVTVTFVDRQPMWSGTVQGDTTTPAGESVVILFPQDARDHVDYGAVPRRVVSIPVQTDGAFSTVAPPPGDYYVLAVPAAGADDWRNPAQLARWSTIADRVTLTSDPQTMTVRVRRTP